MRQATPAPVREPAPIGRCYAAVWGHAADSGPQLPLLLVYAGQDSLDSVRVRHVTMHDLRQARVVEVDSALAVLVGLWLTPRGVPLATRHADGHFGPIASSFPGDTRPRAAIADTTPVGVITQVIGPVTMVGQRWQCIGAPAT